MSVRYKYKAVAPDGREQTGTIAADSSVSVEEFLYNQQLVPVTISEQKARPPFSLFGFLKGAQYEKLIMFTSALATMHRAGIPLLRSLSVIRIGDPSGRFNEAIDRLRTDIQAGKPMSEAMHEFPDLFSDVYVSCIAAGEESGRLDQTLEELSRMLERESELTRQLKAGLQRPLLVIFAIMGAVVVLMNLVVPRFVSFYQTFSAELPWPTRVLIGASHLATGYWPVALALTIAAVFGFRLLLQNETGRFWFDGRLLKLPLFGDLIVKGNFARFALLLRILVNSGLGIVNSVQILAGTSRNTVLAKEIRTLSEMFEAGREVDANSDELPHFPKQAMYMLAVGLESGNLDAVLGELGDYYTRQAIHTSSQLTAVIEPLLTFVMAGFVLILALAVFLPMWNLIRVFHP